jgi:hypothetical protein
VEFRSWVKIPGLQQEQEQEHERLYELLLRDHVDLGPVMTWRDGGSSTVVVLAADAEDEASAVDLMRSAVANSLHVGGLGYLDPIVVEVESVAAV